MGYMGAVARILTFVLVCLLGRPLLAAHTHAKLLLAAETAKPGDTVWAGIQLKMDRGWHTYWKNPGASGKPTDIKWELPSGVTAGETQWPIPEKLPEEDLTTYIYKGEVVLLVPLKLAADLPAKPLELKAKLSWLECEIQCVPGSADIEATLAVGAETKPSPESKLISMWNSKVPQPGAALGARAWWGGPAKGDLRPLVLEWTSFGTKGEPDFFPYGSEQFEVQANAKMLSASPDKIRLQTAVKKFEGEWPARIGGLAIQKEGANTAAFEVRLPVEASGPASVASTDSSPASGVASVWKMLLYALIGGLILNVMPCVLPVIAIKIVGFVGEANSDPGRVRRLGLIYTLGVLVSFLVLAGLVIGVKAAGHQAGWGMQFGNPQFLILLTVLVTLVALNLFGVFEVNLSGKVMGAAGTLASKHGYAGAFFNGVLATVLATPCTAPFLGAALGFAFAQSAGIIILIFLTVGFGLALPYVVLSWHPAWLKFLPKPGLWMERFKQAMGFPMLATAIWLMSLLPIHYGPRAWWAGIFLVLIAVAAWVFGDFYQRGRSRRGLGLVAAILILALGYGLVLEQQLHWRSPDAGTVLAQTNDDPGGIAWKPWSREAVEAAQAAGHPVLVDFTAKWCLTCNTIVKPALENQAVRKKLEELSAVALLADYTKLPDSITQELARFGRAGVPLVLVYSPDSNRSPDVFDVVTPGVVVDALQRAKR